MRNPARERVLLLPTHTRREPGDVAAATRCLRIAIALPRTERVGADVRLASHLLADQRLDEAARLGEAICEKTLAG